VAINTQNFEPTLSCITLIQEGFQFNLIRSSTNLVLPPAYQASTLPISFNLRSFSTPKNGSGAEIWSSPKTCSLVDDGPDGSGVVLLEGEMLLPLFEGVFSSFLLAESGSLAYLKTGWPNLAQSWNRPAFALIGSVDPLVLLSSVLMLVILEALLVQVLPQIFS